MIYCLRSISSQTPRRASPQGSGELWVVAGVMGAVAATVDEIFAAVVVVVTALLPVPFTEAVVVCTEAVPLPTVIAVWEIVPALSARIRV